MKQYYAAEMTKNPIWVVLDKQGGIPISVSSSREEAEQWLKDEHYNHPNAWVYCLCIKSDEALIQCMAQLRPDLRTQFDDVADAYHVERKYSQQEIDTTNNMDTYGGSFVKNLAMCFRTADPINFTKLRHTFAEYWEQYANFKKG